MLQHHRELRRLYIFWILHQTTTCWRMAILTSRCISFESYIKPQPQCLACLHSDVVYLLNPTSNHNSTGMSNSGETVVYLLNPTSNHNHSVQTLRRLVVVYLLNPTSNHNQTGEQPDTSLLYIFWILHQTTTHFGCGFLHLCCISFESYIKPQLPWYYYPPLRRCISFESYIKPQPCSRLLQAVACCISFESYIKPQLFHLLVRICSVVYLLNPTSNHNHKALIRLSLTVVYLLNPTSNHNWKQDIINFKKLYIFWILHQTTTKRSSQRRKEQLYIFWILHQTTTWQAYLSISLRCISFESYIKPQLYEMNPGDSIVVYLLNPTSNHNL